MNFSIHQASHIGNRKFNQDRAAHAYTNDALLVVLADGMGGHLHGELAAELAIATFVESFARRANPRITDPDEFIQGTMRYAHERIMKFPHDKNMGGFPGTTCIAALVQDGTIYWGHAGDSRLYLLRDGAILARTNDHSLVQQWVESGRMSPDEARIHPQRNHITNCLGGIDAVLNPEPGEPVTLQSGDIALLASDGLWGPFSDRELTEALTTAPVAEVLDNLIASALIREGGHSDNITGVALCWGSDEAAHDTTAPVSHVLEIN